VPYTQVESQSPPFACVTTPHGRGAVWVHLAGELDRATTPQLAWTLSEPPLVEAPLVVLDLRGLTFIDSAGLEVIVQASIRARRRERRLLVVRGIPRVQRIFAVTGCDEDVEILDLDVFDLEQDQAS
jgi:anti-sigma B factor antagonist